MTAIGLLLWAAGKFFARIEYENIVRWNGYGCALGMVLMTFGFTLGSIGFVAWVWKVMP